jgi:hypothetical protein
MENVKVGQIYAYDVDGMVSTCHPGTYTVEVLAVHERHRPSASFFDNDYDDGSPIAPLVDCKSIQSDEEFSCDAGHLTDISTLCKMYQAAKDSLDDFDGIEKEIVEKKIKRMAKIVKKSTSQFNEVAGIEPREPEA